MRSPNRMLSKAILISTLLLILSIQILVTSATSATGTITGRIVSTTISVNNITLGDLKADPDVYYYKVANGLGSVEINNVASDIIPFATIDFAMNNGYIQISLGKNKVLPNGAKIILDDDKTPDTKEIDPNQIQITGDASNQATISYAGKDGDYRISYSNDGFLYVFINTGSATSGNINVDIVITS